MSIKYNSLADIPEDLKWLAENITEWPTRHNGSEVENICRSDVVPAGYDRIHPTDHEDENDYTRAEWGAAKECLARCKSEAVKWKPQDMALVNGVEVVLIGLIDPAKNNIWAFCIADGKGTKLDFIAGNYLEKPKTASELAAEKATKERGELMNDLYDNLRDEHKISNITTIAAIVDWHLSRIKGSE